MAEILFKSPNLPSSLSQLSLPGFDCLPIKPVNVSLVQHLSPFRYPGGKTWLVPWLGNWVKQLDFKPAMFLEPFAGGASCGLSIAWTKAADEVLLVERDQQVASVWRVIFGKSDVRRKELVDQITSFELTRENVEKLLSQKPSRLVEIAFQTIVRNRVNQGGILAPGAGMLSGGENGKGLLSRWYPETLKRRIDLISPIRDRVKFRQADGLEAMKEFSDREDVVTFVDPPYTVGGKRVGERLYRHSEIDHNELFSIVNSMKGAVILTYDDTPEVRKACAKYKFRLIQFPMKSNRHKQVSELILIKSVGVSD